MEQEDEGMRIVIDLFGYDEYPDDSVEEDIRRVILDAIPDLELSDVDIYCVPD